MAKASSASKVTLQNEEELVLRPLNIKLFRQFQERWVSMIEEAGEGAEVLDQVDALIDLAAICTSRELGDRANDREWLEEVLDFDTIYMILKVCADVDLNPANLKTTAQAAVSGQTSI